MEKSYSRVAIILFVVFVAGTLAGQTTTDVPLTVSFSAPESAPSLHEPVYIDVTIQNRSAQTIEVDLGIKRKANFQFIIETPGGVTVRPPRLISSGIGPLSRIPVGSGQTYQQRLLLNEWFQFDLPGDYSVKATLLATVRSVEGATLKKEWSGQIPLWVQPRNEDRLRSICQDLVEAAVNPHDSRIARDAAFALSYIVDPVAVPYLEQVLKESYFGKELAIQGLGRISNAEAVRVLRSAMADADAELKMLIQRELMRARNTDH